MFYKEWQLLQEGFVDEDGYFQWHEINGRPIVNPNGVDIEAEFVNLANIVRIGFVRLYNSIIRFTQSLGNPDVNGFSIWNMLDKNDIIYPLYKNQRKL